MEKSSDAFRTISEVAEELDLPQHVLRFWETRFPHIRPLKRAGGRRYYRPADILLLRTIRQLLYDEGYTIKGVQRLLKEQGPRSLRSGDPTPPPGLDFDLADAPPDAGLHEAFVETVTPLAAAIAADPAGPQGSHVPGSRAALLDMLGTIEECTRILDALRRQE